MMLWNVFARPRLIQIVFSSLLLISIFIFLTDLSHPFQTLPSPSFIRHKGSEPGTELPLILEEPLGLEFPHAIETSHVVEKPSLPDNSSEKEILPNKEDAPSEDGSSFLEDPVSKEFLPVEGDVSTQEELSAHGDSPANEELPAHEEKLDEDSDSVKDEGKILTPPAYVYATPNTSGRKERLAYLTFLSETEDSGDDLEKDKYFIAVRILVWQLLHNPETRTKHDVVVMVTPSVSKSRRDRLQRDGAIVHAVDFLRTENDEWIHPQEHRWNDVMTKMRVWELTQYDRILMLDGDSMLVRSLDPVFDDPAAQLLATKASNDTSLPPTYLVASNSEVWDSNHTFPPTHGTGLKKPGYMNAGFFILAPSLHAFEYYKSLINTPHSFDPKYPEQNLINHVHRWDSPMPWRELAYTWNLRCPNDEDFEKGLYSVHEKWWTQPYIHGNDKTKEWLFTRRWEMKGWYDAWDRRNENGTP